MPENNCFDISRPRFFSGTAAGSTREKAGVIYHFNPVPDLKVRATNISIKFLYGQTLNSYCKMIKN